MRNNSPITTENLGIEMRDAALKKSYKIFPMKLLRDYIEMNWQEARSRTNREDL